MSESCVCCEIAEALSARGDDEIVALGSAWLLNREVEAQRPAMVLQTRRHVAHMGELTRVESESLGQILPALEAALREITGAARVHVLLIAESADHVHWHFIPRHPADAEGVGTDLLRRAWPADEPTDLLSRVGQRLGQDVRLGGRPVEPSPVVRHVVSALDAVQRMTLYDALVRRWRGPLARDPSPPSFPGWVERILAATGQPRSRRASADAATVYVMAWLVSLAIALGVAIAAQHTWLAVLAGLPAAVRAIDLASFQLRMLLDRRASFLASFERTLLFLGLNVAEMVIALGTLLIGWDGQSPGSALRAAFGIVTLTNTPAIPTTLSFLLWIIFTVISIILLVGAGGIVLSLVARDVDEAPHETKPRGVASDDGM